MKCSLSDPEQKKFRINRKVFKFEHEMSYERFLQWGTGRGEPFRQDRWRGHDRHSHLQKKRVGSDLGGESGKNCCCCLRKAMILGHQNCWNSVANLQNVEPRTSSSSSFPFFLLFFTENFEWESLLSWIFWGSCNCRLTGGRERESLPVRTWILKFRKTRFNVFFPYCVNLDSFVTSSIK